MTRHYEPKCDRGTFAWKDLDGPPKVDDGSDFMRGLGWGVLLSVLLWAIVGVVVAVVWQ